MFLMPVALNVQEGPVGYTAACPADSIPPWQIKQFYNTQAGEWCSTVNSTLWKAIINMSQQQRKTLSPGKKNSPRAPETSEAVQCSIKHFRRLALERGDQKGGWLCDLSGSHECLLAMPGTLPTGLPVSGRKRPLSPESTKRCSFLVSCFLVSPNYFFLNVRCSFAFLE